MDSINKDQYTGSKKKDTPALLLSLTQFQQGFQNHVSLVSNLSMHSILSTLCARALDDDPTPDALMQPPRACRHFAI
jgi:hypothetical protein